MYKHSQVKGALQPEFMNQKTPGLSNWNYYLTPVEDKLSACQSTVDQIMTPVKAKVNQRQSEWWNVTLCKDFKLFYSLILHFLVVYI